MSISESSSIETDCRVGKVGALSLVLEGGAWDFLADLGWGGGG